MIRQRGLHQVHETEVGSIPIIIYRLLGQIDGRGYFAEVCLRKDEPQQGQQIIFHAQTPLPIGEFRGYNALQYNEHDEYCQSVAFGIYYALANHEARAHIEPCTITVLHVGERIVDTTLDTIAYTSALATWKLLRIEPAHEPYIENHQIQFPGRKPTIIINDK